MAVVRRIRNRGATITVEANAEVLFMPGGQVHNWTNRFTGRIRAATIAAAPTNKRPRWGHYGKPLKTTIVSARPRFWSNGGDKQRVYGAVGSTAPHAYYVDQGTGVYNGSGPYAAKVLPPWQRGEGSLYEATWRPLGPGTRRVNPIMIRGQKGQGFFDAGLRAAFQSMRLRSAQVAGEAKIGEVLNSMPTGLDNFKGNTPADAGFIASLEEWRTWRDAAWDRGDMLGRNIRPVNRLKPRPPRKVEANLRAYQASIDAAKRRAEEQAKRLAAERARREEGRRKQAERDRKLREANALRRGNAMMKAEAQKFYDMIRKAYPNATFRSTTLPDGVIAYRVTYTQADGDVVRKTWAHGYNTD